MIFDSAFTIGKTHRVCEDFAIHNDRMAVLSDGCSSAHHTDIGSRILCSSAMKYNGTSDIKNIIHHSNMIANNLGYPQDILSATLISIERILKDSVKIDIFGDGVVVFVDSDGTHRFISIEFDNEMPNYPLYQLSDEMLSQYKTKNISRTIQGEIPEYATLNEHENHISIVSNVKNSITCFSDGANSFTNADNKEMQFELTDFKNRNDGFAKRRLNKFSKGIVSRGITHYDDLSMISVLSNEVSL